MPEIVFVALDPVLGRSEPDYEIRNLVRSSGGLNLALDYLPGALGFDAARIADVPPELASIIVWLDAFIANVDRTARNTNLIWWHRRLHLIDHGAALYYQHDWPGYAAQALNPFRQVRDHVLLPVADALERADALAHARLDSARLEAIVAGLPDDWLEANPEAGSADEARAVHARFLTTRLEASQVFVTEALSARHAHV